MKNLQSLIFIGLPLLLFQGCGKDSEKNISMSPAPAIEEQVAEGKYRAILRPMNNHLSGFLPTGFAEIQIAEQEVKIRTLLDDNAKATKHIQSIQFGTRCPSPSDDTNGDGVIDIEESYSASGEVFIPLDGDLTSAEKGAGIYPTGRGFSYFETASLSDLQFDTKERTQQNLNLSGRVVLIHGVDGNTQLPASVASRDGLSSTSLVPVACGILERL